MLRLSVTTDPDVSAADLRRLSALLEKHDLTELRYEQGDVRVTLRTATFFRQRMSAATPCVAAPLAAPEGEPFSGDDGDAPFTAALVAVPGVRIEAPIMGVFYRTATPDDPPVVEVGDAVEAGQVVGLIEAMKVFSEIKSDTAGVVREISAPHKALVQPGDALVILDTA